LLIGIDKEGNTCLSITNIWATDPFDSKHIHYPLATTAGNSGSAVFAIKRTKKGTEIERIVLVGLHAA